MMDSENIFTDSQSTYCSDSSDILDIDPAILTNPQALLQDCMWNCEAYEPRHSIGCNGIYTPAPSPPPEAKEAMEEDGEEGEQIATFGVDKTGEGAAECISPNEVLVFTGTVECATAGKEEQSSNTATATTANCQDRKMNGDTRKTSLSYRRSISSVSSGSSRIHPQAASSESGVCRKPIAAGLLKELLNPWSTLVLRPQYSQVCFPVNLIFCLDSFLSQYSQNAKPLFDAHFSLALHCHCLQQT